KNLRNLGGAGGDATETEQGGNQGNDKEDKGIAEHGGPRFRLRKDQREWTPGWETALSGFRLPAASSGVGGRFSGSTTGASPRSGSSILGGLGCGNNSAGSSDWAVLVSDALAVPAPISRSRIVVSLDVICVFIQCGYYEMALG